VLNHETYSVNLKKVAVIGPECTGKSELSEYLAGEFDTVWVREYARQYLEGLDRPYNAGDLPRIAAGQLSMEDQMAALANKVLICDTDLHVIKIWSLFKYGYCDQKILDAIADRKYDLYLLTYIDIPWEFDPQREHPDERESLYALYLDEMKNQKVPFAEIKGNREQRRRTAMQRVQELLYR
jgi:NadR type nicotinamide-nucleotide adenylyltransferase